MLTEKPWRAEAVLQFCAAQIVCLFIGIVIVTVLHKLEIRGFRSDESLGSIMVGTLCLQGAAWPLILLFLRRHRVSWGTAFGFRGPRPGIALLSALLFIVVVLPVVLGLQWTSIHVLERFGVPPENQAAVRLLTDARSIATTVYLGLFAVLIAPVAEEFIFRGMLLPFIKQLRSPELVKFLRHRGHPRLAWFSRRCGWRMLAWFGTSALFAFIHLNLQTFVPLFVFALALAWLYEQTDNLLAPITAHALFNALNFAVLVWQIQHPPA